jgi:pimeloyl-ACP methyl ester carboxylesterase
MSTVTSADGTSIDYERHGEGPAVLLVGGATQYRGVDASTAEVARRLGAEGFSAVAYDRRGRGRSGDTPPWSLDREVEDVAALVDAVGGPAALYTSSSGATVALAAVDAGVPVSSLLLYEPPFFRNERGAEQLAHLRSLLAEDRRDEAIRYNMTDVVGVPAQQVEGMAQAPWWPAFVAVAPTLLYDLGAVHDVDTDPDWQRRWAGVTVPVTVLSGEQSFPGMAQVADAVAAAIPHARRRVLAGQGHGPAPDALVPVLVELLREVSS